MWVWINNSDDTKQLRQDLWDKIVKLCVSLNKKLWWYEQQQPVEETVPHVHLSKADRYWCWCRRRPGREDQLPTLPEHCKCPSHLALPASLCRLHSLRSSDWWRTAYVRLRGCTESKGQFQNVAGTLPSTASTHLTHMCARSVSECCLVLCLALHHVCKVCDCITLQRKGECDGWGRGR